MRGSVLVVIGTVRDPRVRLAIGASSLRGLPSDVLDALTRGSRLLRIGSRTTIHHEGEDAPHLELVVSGLVRVRVSAPDGRALTVRYARSGALLGAATLYASVVRPFSIQAVFEAELLSFRPVVVRERANADPLVARALLIETSERVLSFVAAFSGHAFGSLRQRIARHLLDLAMEAETSAELLAPVSQQELAEAVGSVREVVVRVLRELREAGVIRTGRSGIAIVDGERLAALASPSWNEGS